MSKPMWKHDGTNVLIKLPNVGILLAEGTTFPADATAGYAPGCLFFDVDATAANQWYRNDGTLASSDFNLVTGGVSLATLTATAAELNVLDDANATLATAPGAGITGGTGTVIKYNVLRLNNLIVTQIYIDLTGLGAIATDLDIIGVSTTPAHLGQVTVARNGTLEAIRMTCLELPAGASTDIDLYSAVEATGKLDDAIATLFTETALVTAGGVWTNGAVKGATAMPAASDYLYLVNGAAANAGTYTAGKFLIELFGY